MIWLEGLSYLVTILGFPAAIYVIVREERLRRANEISELHRSLSQEYDGFLRMVMDNADLLLMSRACLPEPVSEEQRERIEIIYRMLLSLFEKAFIILHSDDMDGDAQRRWSSWEDDMMEWCSREDFRRLLTKLLDGEDPQFRAYILHLGQRCAEKAAQA
ncbi:hypothetical protein [Tateyamaria sp. ANG-S1]|uniref:hypothetical protein n=1 Tax=Tateyamaria sp. ANG-S1 TaxID=1577905 RepID=UPI00057E1E69|nr:hypothetical protein [Tateyamaria sp. ANG-S1]KIC50384.1 hypothetical protein RA29_06650 [Tateyamaria sp. ANG-S1]